MNFSFIKDTRATGILHLCKPSQFFWIIAMFLFLFEKEKKEDSFIGRSA